MLVNMRKMLWDAKDNGYAVPQFNINNLEWTRFILEECNLRKTPVILGVSEGAAKYMGGFYTVVSIVKGLLKDLDIKIPVAIHLDHASSFESCKAAIDAGFTSVMIDASAKSLEENVDITKQVLKYARMYDVTVEGEVGHVGQNDENVCYAVLEDCIDYVQQTDVDFLAPAIGSVHGLYKGDPNINFELISKIRENINKPLVLHGGTGIYDDQIKRAISCGICKININTELQIAWTNAIRKFLNEDEKVYDPRKVIKSGESAIKNCISAKIDLFNTGIINK